MTQSRASALAINLGIVSVVLLVAIPPVGIICVIVAIVAQCIKNGHHRAARHVAEVHAYQKWERDRVLAAKSLP